MNNRPAATPFTHDPSMTAAFRALADEPSVVPERDPLKAVVIGGGTGASVSIRTLLSLGLQTSAVVAMADDGGSTGILREAAHALPPGDIRKCLSAFAADADDPLTRAFRYRFPFAQNHTLGNLLLSALEDATGSFPEAVAICEQLLHVRGHVYPSTLDEIYLCGKTRDGQLLHGQAKASAAPGALESVWFDDNSLCRPYGPALQAIREADLIIIGPGSLYTSLIPNLLVPGVVAAIEDAHATTIFVCALHDGQGETRSLRVVDHVRALLDHGLLGLLNLVLVDNHGYRRASGPSKSEQLSPMARVLGAHGKKPAPSAPAEEAPDLETSNRPVPIDDEDIAWLESMGIGVYVRDLSSRDQQGMHDPAALRNLFTEILHPFL